MFRKKLVLITAVVPATERQTIKGWLPKGNISYGTILRHKKPHKWEILPKVSVGQPAIKKHTYLLFYQISKETEGTDFN